MSGGLQRRALAPAAAATMMEPRNMEDLPPLCTVHEAGDVGRPGHWIDGGG